MKIYRDIIKRVLDIILSAVVLLLFSLPLIFVALIIKIEDGGPVFYRGVRVGKDGKPFRVFKFRTMIVDAERKGGSSTSDNDPRITRIGKKIRKYKLDELPELINVLKGDMSIVGPRPEVQEYAKRFSEEERTILSARPGITDWATLWNPDEGSVLCRFSDPDKAYEALIRPKKLQLQMKYVEEISFCNDIKIILETFWVIARRKKSPLELELESKGLYENQQ